MTRELSGLVGAVHWAGGRAAPDHGHRRVQTAHLESRLPGRFAGNPNHGVVDSKSVERWYHLDA